MISLASGLHSSQDASDIVADQAFLSGSHKAHFSYSGEGAKQWAPNATGGAFEEGIMRSMENYVRA